MTKKKFDPKERLEGLKKSEDLFKGLNNTELSEMVKYLNGLTLKGQNDERGIPESKGINLDDVDDILSNLSDKTIKELTKRLVKVELRKDKTLNNIDKEVAKTQVKDIEFWGNGDSFKLISKASSQSEGWMKSTKAMHIKGLGCLVQVTTQQGDNIAEAVTFVPNTKISEQVEKGKVVGRYIEVDVRSFR